MTWGLGHEIWREGRVAVGVFLGFLTSVTSAQYGQNAPH